MDASRGTFAEVLPGPELAAALAAVDRSGLDGDGQAELLRARWRLLAWLQAEHLHHLAFRHRNGFTVTKAGTTTSWTVPNGLNFTVSIDDDVVLTHEDDG